MPAAKPLSASATLLRIAWNSSLLTVRAIPIVREVFGGAGSVGLGVGAVATVGAAVVAVAAAVVLDSLSVPPSDPDPEMQ